MPIDPRMVRWEEDKPSAGIDPRMVNWGSAPPSGNLISLDASRTAAEGVGIPQAAAIALGQGFDKAAMGLKELTLKGVRRFGPKSFATAANNELQSLAEAEKEKDSAFAGLQQARPITTGLAQAGPAMMASGGMGIVPAALTMGGFEALKPGTAQERLSRGAVNTAGALVGGYVGNKVASAVAPVGNNMVNAAQREALAAAQRVGYKPRLALFGQTMPPRSEKAGWPATLSTISVSLGSG